MYRYRLHIITSIVIIAAIGLSVGFMSQEAAAPSENISSSDLAEKVQPNPKENALQVRRQQELQIALQAYFDQAIASGDIVGAGVSIVKGNSIVISEGFGKKNIRSQEAVDGQTIFRLGSLSKGFAGILAADIIDEGKLHWEDKVRDYIPGFQLGDRQNTDKITLANILSHTAGAPYHSYTNLIEAGLPLTDIATRFKEVNPISKPGAMYSYQNALFALSSEMIHKATGEDITKSLENRFFNPLEMCSTSMDHETLVNAGNVALPHTRWRNSWRPRPLNDHYYNAVAAGGISANAADMGKWMKFLLGHHPDIMNKSALEEAFTPFIEIKGSRKYYQRWPGHVSSYYGYGWRIHKFVEDKTAQEKTIWHHGGSVNNYRNEIAIYPESDMGICVLLNSNSKLAKTVVPDVYKIVKEVYQQTESQLSFNEVSIDTEPLAASASFH
ncbi:serine hydrolase [Zeaxanthinibacter sp. PT1]|uniref:serine hydrolase domain-containing protein n=1 Tax=Zeaxanthinibacter TaxID=561554 RepID=UPI002349D8F1|nr:serine hydrolase domain-containing protein [Zeaxanthinibacter sp. PT1]MDC6351397.1 serine hydrolase [Zeaxanthinibacter sp. PT1]